MTTTPTDTPNADTDRTALLVCLPTGVSLADLDACGALVRECGVTARLAGVYPLVMLVSFGGEADSPVAESLGCRWVAGSDALETIAESVKSACVVAGVSRLLIKADQMAGCGYACELLGAISERSGLQTRLMASAGHRWSRFLAREEGPDSEGARLAGDDERALCEVADAVAANNADTVADLAWRYTLDTRRTVVVPSAVAGDETVTPVTARSGRIVTSAGDLIKRKGFALLIRAIAGMSGSRRDDVTLRLVGAGPRREALLDLAEELGVTLEIVEPRSHAEMLEQLGSCAVYVQASEHEGDPRAVLEAMACGSACVVSDAPGLGELVEHAVTGLRAPREPEAFARMIEGLLDDAEWAEAMGQAAARTVRSRFGLDPAVQAELKAHDVAFACEGEVESAA